MTIFNKFKVGIFDKDSSSANTQALSSEQRLQSYVNQCIEKSSRAIILCDCEAKITYANKAMLLLVNNNLSDFQHASPRFSGQNIVGHDARAIVGDLKSLLKSQVRNINIGTMVTELSLAELIGADKVKDGYMLELVDQSAFKNNEGILNAMDRSQAVIEFSPEGKILTANKNFLSAMDYSLSDIKGQHHSMFAPPELKGSAEYDNFWKRLRAGEFYTDEIRRIKNGGQEIWLSASYNPVFDENKRVVKVIKFAVDITDEKQLSNEFAGQIAAIRANQAVIEFNMDGSIIDANEAFLATTGYRIEEIKGKHHRIFVTKELAQSNEYSLLWSNLNAGEAFVDEIERVAKDGSTLCLNASYNPIFDSNGKAFKVVKFATDITERKNLVDDLQSALEKLAEGDLNVSIDVAQNSPFYPIAQSMNHFVENFKDMLRQMHESIDLTKSAAAEIATGNSDLSARTEQQAAGLQQTTATMEGLSNTIKQTSNQSNEANQLAEGASEIATSGGDLIGQVVDNMASITDSADKISEIIGVIDGIAFQTNILALNAAVEAARAGEQGRGFAVVASEVRTLAQRSANAAKDIKNLISDSVERIQMGNKLVNNSGETMSQIVSSIKNVTDTIALINKASSEQSTAISEVASTIKNMDMMTQQNSALVEEVAASSESMQQQSNNLGQSIARFLN